MMFNKVTYTVTFCILIVTALYMLIYTGLTGILLYASVTLILLGVLDQFEIAIAISVLCAIFYVYYLKNYFKRMENFVGTEQQKEPEKPKQKETFKDVTGVYGSYIEGFAPANDKKEPLDGHSSTSNPDTPNPKDTVKNEVKVATTTDVTDKKAEGDKVQGFKNEKMSENAIVEDEFKSATNHLFKLGKMPSEHKDGPMLDAGSTLLKAMGSFKPEQINAMSTDTKQLLETQKDLMKMLNQMRPVLADGKELLNTFSGMFGNNGLKL